MDLNHPIQNIRKTNPLVHNITNLVVANDVANTLLAIGASPIMALAVEEVEEVVTLADAVVLNLGTPTLQRIDSLLAAGKKANDLNVPVIFDPVGVGATHFRQTAAQQLLESVDFSVIRGNTAEIASLIGVHRLAKGVDAAGSDDLPVDIAAQCAREHSCIVAVSGMIDIVSDGHATYSIHNGDSLLGRITGSGCMLSGIIGAFLSNMASTDWLTATVKAHCAFGIAAEKAVASGVSGPGTFRAGLIDALADLTDDELTHNHRMEKINV